MHRAKHTHTRQAHTHAKKTILALIHSFPAPPPPLLFFPISSSFLVPCFRLCVGKLNAPKIRAYDIFLAVMFPLTPLFLNSFIDFRLFLRDNLSVLQEVAAGGVPIWGDCKPSSSLLGLKIPQEAKITA